MKYINKFSIRVFAAIFSGLFIAGVSTKINYSCAPIDGALGCVSFDKAVMHLGDLISNKQNSLISFSVAFLITSLVVLGLLSILARTQKVKI